MYEGEFPMFILFPVVRIRRRLRHGGRGRHGRTSRRFSAHPVSFRVVRMKSSLNIFSSVVDCYTSIQEFHGSVSLRLLSLP